MTSKVLEILNNIHSLDLKADQFQIVMAVITEVGQLAYDEGFEHGRNEGYGDGYQSGWTASETFKADNPPKIEEEIPF